MMAKLSTTGAELLLSKFDKLAAMVSTRGGEAVQAGTEVLRQELYRRHPVRTGKTREHMVAKKPVQGLDGWSSVITWTGKNSHGTRYAEIAFINEYGRSSQRAQPFIRPGKAAAADEVMETMRRVLTEGMNE